jgi:hypothetical protein
MSDARTALCRTGHLLSAACMHDARQQTALAHLASNASLATAERSKAMFTPDTGPYAVAGYAGACGSSPALPQLLQTLFQTCTCCWARPRVVLVAGHTCGYNLQFPKQSFCIIDDFDQFASSMALRERRQLQNSLHRSTCEHA